MRLVWVTDPHLNHVPVAAWDKWIEAILACGKDGLLVSGDISEGDDVVFQLQRLSEALELPIYFVLGNHDFYQSSISVTRRRVMEISRDNPALFYLTDLGPLELSEGVFLIGEDGWGDATEGDFENSTVALNDFHLIDDFRLAHYRDWQSMLGHLGQESAQRLAAKFAEIPADARAIIVLTHVPPYREACWYQGHVTDDNWAPFFVCGQTGRTMLQAAAARPDCRIRVLCGHTHHRGIADIAANLQVHTGAADYGSPDVEGLIEIESGSLRILTGDQLDDAN